MITLIGYSGVLLDISQADKLNQSYDLPHNDKMSPDKVLSFGGRYIIRLECRQMVLYFVTVCCCRVNIYKRLKRIE